VVSLAFCFMSGKELIIAIGQMDERDSEPVRKWWRWEKFLSLPGIKPWLSSLEPDTSLTRLSQLII
jgi:hypothetical protein